MANEKNRVGSNHNGKTNADQQLTMAPGRWTYDGRLREHHDVGLKDQGCKGLGYNGERQGKGKMGIDVGRRQSSRSIGARMDLEDRNSISNQGRESK